MEPGQTVPASQGVSRKSAGRISSDKTVPVGQAVEVENAGSISFKIRTHL
jgi:hypothetical protein